MSDQYTSIVIQALRKRLRDGHMVRMTVVSRSMLPLIRSGDGVWVAYGTLDHMTRGEVVTFQHGSNLYTHRLVSDGSTGGLTSGDNSLTHDPPLARADLLGRVVVVERGHTTVDLRGLPWWTANRVLGWLHWHKGRCFAARQLAGYPLACLACRGIKLVAWSLLYWTLWRTHKGTR